MNNNEQEALKNKIYKSSGGKIGKSDIDKAQSGDMTALFSLLNENDRKKLKQALNNKALAEKILKSPEAQSIINSIKGDKRNG